MISFTDQSMPTADANADNFSQLLQRLNLNIKQIEQNGLDIQLLLPVVLELAATAVHATFGSIVITNEERQIEHTCFLDEKADRRPPDAFLYEVINKGVSGWVISKREPYIVTNTCTDELWLNRPDAPTEPWSTISVPLLIRQNAIGAMTLHVVGSGVFTDRDVQTVQLLLADAVSHIENARLFAASQRQLQIAALLNEASRTINSSLDLNEIMQSLLMQMNEFLNAQALSIALVDKQLNELVYQVAEGVGSEEIVGLRLPANHGLSGWVMQHCEPALVTDTSQDARFGRMGDQRTGYDTRAMICAPMQFKGDVLGTIQAINPIEGTFTKQDLNMLVSLANIASTAIANAQQYARTQAVEAQYVGLFQDTINPIVLTDLTGRIVEVNRRTIQLLYYNRADLLQMNIADLYVQDAKPFGPEHIQSDSVKVFTSEIATKEMQKIPVEVYAKRTYYGQGESEILQWIFHDISKHVELEKMRKDLTAMLFHDLQSPLGNVISSLELLSYEIPPMAPDSPLYYMLDIAKRSSERLQALIRSLLDINRLEAGLPITEKTRVDVYDLVDEVLEIERPNFEQRRVHFLIDLLPGLPDVFMEEDMIRRVLTNLIGNALKYSSEGQTVSLRVLMTEEQDYLLVSVSDEGIGVPEEYRQLVFQKFERLKLSGLDTKGLGLGLAFCRLAVEAHNGRIWVDDAPEGGARFNFTLPLKTLMSSATT
jgi:PAS domain S-box-containing protein